MKVDITHHNTASFENNEDQYVYIHGGEKENVVTLVIGDLEITMTEEQENKLRYYFENT